MMLVLRSTHSTGGGYRARPQAPGYVAAAEPPRRRDRAEPDVLLAAALPGKGNEGNFSG